MQARTTEKQSNQDWRFGLPNLGNTCYFNSAIQMFMHCIDLFPWDQSNPQSLKNLFDLKNARENLIKEAVIRLRSGINYPYKELSHSQGNDSMRVFHSIINVSTLPKQYHKIQLKDKPKLLHEDYQYWAEDNSPTSFLFQTVSLQRQICDKCNYTKLIDEQMKYAININSYQIINRSLEKTLQEEGLYTIQQQQCIEGHGKMRIQCNGYIKLPLFLFINLEEGLANRFSNLNDQIKLKDQVRNKEVKYNLVGFISKTSFHYTYYRISQRLCFNDSSVYPVNSLPLINTGKGLLYQATMDSVDPNALELKSKGETEGRLKM